MLLKGISETLIGPERALEQVELHRALHAAFSRLDSNCREVLCLWLEDGLSYEQISEQTGAPPGTVRTRIHRARDHTAEFLEELGCVLPVRTKRRPTRQTLSR